MQITDYRKDDVFGDSYPTEYKQQLDTFGKITSIAACFNIMHSQWGLYLPQEGENWFLVSEKICTLYHVVDIW